MKELNKDLKKKLLKAIKLNEIEKVKIMLEKNNIDFKKWNDPSKTIVQLLENNYNEMFKLLIKQGVILDINYINKSKTLITALENGHIEIVKLLLSLKANPNIKDENKNTLLLLASYSGHTKIIELLLESKVNLDIKNKNGNTALMFASMKGNKEIVELLLDSKADSHIQDKDGKTALMFASNNNNNAEIVKLLLDSKVSPNIRDENGITALMLASMKGNKETVKLLLSLKADPDIKSKYGGTALLLASENGYKEIVKLLLDSKPDLDIKNEYGCTALMKASKNGHVETVKLLLSSKADPDIQEKYGITPLSIASYNGYEEIVEILLENGANPNVRDGTGNIALMYASKNGNKKIIKLLESKTSIDAKIQKSSLSLEEKVEVFFDAIKKNEIEKIDIFLTEGFDVDTKRFNDGMTALMIASINKKNKIVELLIEKKATVDLKKKDGWTALLLASQYGDEEIIKLLLASEADIDIKGENGATALILASENGHKEIVKLLLLSKANPNIKNINGNTALIHSSENGHKEIVKLLLASEAAIDVKGENGVTALILASENGHKEIVKLLLSSKANLNIKNINEITALMSASYNGKEEIVKLLLASEADVEIRGLNGITALILASHNGHKEIVKLLLKSKSNPDIKDNDNNTASEVAKLHGYVEIAEYINSFKLNSDKNEKMKNVDTINEIEKIKNKECDISKSDSTNDPKTELEIFNIKKKIFIVDSFFKSYFAKRLDKEEFETFLYDKGHEILNTKDYRNLCHGDRVKKIKTKNKIFELRINSGDRVIFTFKEDGIIFLCVGNHDIVIEKGKNTEINNLVELSARVEDISEINIDDIIQNSVFEYSSLKEIEQAYENNRELYKLTEEQQNIINQKFPICLYGSAGSGKTTMLLKKIEKILRDNGDVQILFLTHNERLLRYTKGLYETYSGYKLKQIKFKDINGFFKQELSIIDLEDNYFSYEKFKEWFGEKSKYNVKLKELFVLEVFSEIKGIIKGFVGFSGKRDIEKENIISKKYYTELKNKYSLLKNDETREEVYSLAINYEKHLKNKGYYDENDLAMRHLREKNEIPKYDFLVCDEVQDLTELQILSMLKAVKDEKNVFLTGDNNQAINLSFFDFGRLETLYHENYNFKELENSQISINQRSSEKIVELAKKIAEIRENILIPNKKIIYEEEVSIKGGDIPILAPLNIDHLSQLENKDITVIVPNAEIKTEMAKKYENTILTTYESKGMERENIVCVGLVDYFKDDVAKIVKAIENRNVEKLPNHYRHFFNLFYVATTRARKKLVFLDDIDNTFFNSLEGSLFKTNNESWLDHFMGIEDMSDDKLLKYAKEFEEKGLYSEALKNYKKMKEGNLKYILRTESFINFEDKKYKEALEGFINLEIWHECLKCAEKLKDEEGKTEYQLKVYEQEKKYLPLAELHYLNSQSQLAFDSFIKYFREEFLELKGDNQLFFDILPEIDHKNIDEEDKIFIVDISAKNPRFYKLALDILVIDEKYKEARELIELQENKSIDDEFKLFLLKNDGTQWEKGFNELKIKGEKNLYKNFYINSNMSELNNKILREIDLETLDLFIESGFIGNLEIIDSKFVEQILNCKKENLINYYLEKNNIKNDYTDVIEKYLEKCIEKSSGKFIFKRAKQLLDEPYDFILNFYEKDKIKLLINKQLKSEEIGLDIFKKSYKGLIEFDSYIKSKPFRGYNSELILNSLDYSSFELEDLMKYQMDNELDEILLRTGKLLPKELFERLSQEDKVKYGEYYIPYMEEQVNTQVTIINLSKDKKTLKVGGKHLKYIDPMTKIIIDIEDSIIISLGNEERKITLEDVVLGEDKVIFK